MKRTLGGDRLGAGKRQQVELHGYGRSTHDLGYVWRSTMAAGTIVPCMSEVALPGDSWDIDFNMEINTHPTIGPLFGSFKWQIDTFLVPIRLYIRELHNNKLGIGMAMSTVKLPYLRQEAVQKDDELTEYDYDNSQVNPSALIAYLGIRGIGNNISNTGIKTRDFNAIPILGYYDIGKNYYSNKQEEIGAAIHTLPQNLNNELLSATRLRGAVIIPQNPASTIVDLINGDVVELITGGVAQLWEQVLFSTADGLEIGALELFTSILDMGGGSWNGIYNYARYGNMNIVNWRFMTAGELPKTEISVATFPLANIDTQRELILGAAVGVPYNITTISQPPYSWLIQKSGDGAFYSRQFSQEGLLVRTYNSDLFNNWLNTEWIDGVDGIGQITAIDVSGGELFIDSLILARKVYDMLNRVAISGGTYQDYVEVNYDIDTKWRAETPIYMGGMAQELIFQEVVSNAQAEGEPLGTLAGKGRLGGNKKGGHVNIKVDEYSYIMAMVSAVPRIDYSQGNKWDIHLTTMDDFHKPALDQIGFQELITEQMAWWSTFHNGTTWIQRSAGKQPAWINYRTNYNRVYGNFAVPDNEMFMTLNRRYQWESTGEGIADLTTYVDPSKYNFIFAQTSLDSQNFWVQIGVNATVRRKMSTSVVPNL